MTPIQKTREQLEKDIEPYEKLIEIFEHLHMRAKEREQTLAIHHSMLDAQVSQALTTLLEAMPEKHVYKEATDIADHWGMTEDSIARQLDNMKGLGFNEAIDLVTAIIERQIRGEK